MYIYINTYKLACVQYRYQHQYRPSIKATRPFPPVSLPPRPRPPLAPRLSRARALPPAMVYAPKTYQTLMCSSILLSAATISLILSFTSPRHPDNATIILFAYALAPSLALIHHTISSLCSHPDLPSSQTRHSTATSKQIGSTANLLCLALLAVFVLSSGFAVLIQSMVDFTTLDIMAQSVTIAEGPRSKSVAAATGLNDSLASNALVLQALLQIFQGIVLGWMFGVAAQEARIVIAIERGLDPFEVMAHIDADQDDGDSYSTLSYDGAEEDEDK